MKKNTIYLLIINLVLIGVLILIRDYLPSEVPLLYGKPYGIEQLVPKLALTVPPVISCVVIIVNEVLSRFIKNAFLKQLMFGTSVMVTILTTITVVKIVLLVGNF